MSFLGEIKRRKVFQVAAVYAVVAWLIIQIIGVVSEPLSLPSWLDTVVIVLLGVGFPLAVILAWAFEVTPEGVVRDTGDRAPRPPAPAGRRIELVLIGLLVVAVAFLFVENLADEESPLAIDVDSAAEMVSEEDAISGDTLPNSVAVLPFENLSPNADDAYFAIGIHEEILNQLAKIQDLEVIARTAVRRYADSTLSLPEIAGELNVCTIMEGTVRYADGNVRITAQLIDAETQSHIWSETYTRPFENIFDIETEIATEIAERLEAELRPAERARLQRPPTDSHEAYALYLQAIAQITEMGGILVTPDETRALQGLLDRAIEIDPQFALAYATKARDYAYSLVRDREISAGVTIEELERLARENARRALDLDPTLGLAHSALAIVHRFFRRWSEAERAYALALEYSPNDPNLMFDLMYFNFTIGRKAEAVGYGRRFAAADPSPQGRLALATALHWSGDFAAAEDVLRSAIAMDPANAIAHRDLALLSLRLGNRAEARRELRLSEDLQGALRTSMDLAETILVYGLIGSPTDAQRLFAVLEERSERYEMGAGVWAPAYLGIGDEAAALGELERAAGTLNPDNGFLGLFEIAWNLWSDPRLEQPEFVDVRERLGFRP
jgi:TolB-like protein/Flp pilus assembly protein TadD